MSIKNYITDFNDFPRSGVIFKDISPLLASPEMFAKVVDSLALLAKDADVIAAPDARGFIFGTPVALKLGVPFVMVRKAGKLPGPLMRQEYDLEYGQNQLEIATNAIGKDKKVVIIDDLLALGGTAWAISELVKRQGSSVTKAIFVIELTKYNGRKKLPDLTTHSLVKY